jgi:PAS domain S-box-containing protein
VTTAAIPAIVLVVDAPEDADAVLAAPFVDTAELRFERAADAEEAVRRVDAGQPVEVVLLGPRLADPVRVAQRLQTLDRDGAVVILAAPGREGEIRRALNVAPFLEGDVVCVAAGDPALADILAAAGRRTRDRRRAERRGRETPPPLSARYLGTLLDSAPIGIVTLDAGVCVIGWNRRAGEMLGVPEVEALGVSFAELWPESERAGLAALVESLDASGLDTPGVTFTRGGQAFELTGARFAIRSGESGAILVLQDVTQRVAAERELLLQKALLEAQAESSEAGIAIVSPDGTLERVNRRFAEMWRLDAQALEGGRGRLVEIMTEQVEDPDAFMAPAAALANDPTIDHRDELRLRDGRVIERYSTLARAPDGMVVGRVSFHTDITARKRDEEALRFLAEATDVLYSSLDYETTLRRVADLAVARVADWCSVDVVADGGRRQVAVAHKDPARVAIVRELQERYPTDEDDDQGVGRALRTGESVLFSEIPDELLVDAARDEEHLRMLRALGLRSLMIVPMVTRGRVLGVINFASSESGHVFDRDDVELADELAHRAAIAVDNARVHGAMRETARTLQESLLPPHLPVVEGIDAAARFRPAGSGLEVGGDFYDFFELGRGRWGILVGDVCGKGAEAAALTALTRYTARAAAMYEPSAAGVLRVLNEALLRQHVDYRFTTLVYCVLDVGLQGARLSVAAGGHPPPLVLRAGGSAEVVRARGPLLGVFRTPRFDEVALPLGVGDSVVLYTDGLTDAAAPKRVVGEDELLAELERCRGLGATEITARLEELALGDREPRDDVALLAVRLVPS